MRAILTVSLITFAVPATAQLPAPNSVATCVYVATMKIVQHKPMRFRSFFKRTSQQTYEAMKKTTFGKTSAVSSFKNARYFLTISAPCKSFDGSKQARKILLRRMLFKKWHLLRIQAPDLCCWSRKIKPE